MAGNQPDSPEILSLLEQVRAGDRVALDQLFGGQRPYLQRFIELRLDPKLRARVDPSDVVQEAQLEAVRRLQDYLASPALPFRLWLRQIAQDRIQKVWRFHAGASRRDVQRELALPEGSSLQLAQQLVARGATPSQALDRRELANQLRQAVEQLSEADREIILLRHFEGLSNQEVGCLLGIDPATASKRHGRAMLRLHKVLFAKGLTDSQP